MYYLVLLADKFQKVVCFICLSNSTLCLSVPMETDAHIHRYMLYVRIWWWYCKQNFRAI